MKFSFYYSNYNYCAKIFLGSDQTSLHNPYQGGYIPVQLSYQDSINYMESKPDQFKNLVKERLVFFIVQFK
jgi:urocanate hydratase